MERSERTKSFATSDNEDRMSEKNRDRELRGTIFVSGREKQRMTLDNSDLVDKNNLERSAFN